MEIILLMGERETALGKIEKMDGGIIRTSQAISMGIQPRALYALRDSGDLVELSRGVYRLESKVISENQDLIAVSQRVPNGVICLISALSFHNMTTQIPGAVYIAVDRNRETPKITYPPVNIHRFTGNAFSEGIEINKLDGVHVKVYSPEKTLADCFKFRNKLGLEIVLEATKLYWERKKPQVGTILKYAKVCRVEKIITPYLESKL